MTDDGQGLLEAELRLRAEQTPAAFGRAVWRLVLGDAAGSLEAMREQYAELRNDPRGGFYRAVLPLLIGDRDAVVTEARRELAQPSERWVAGHREYRGAMIALLAEHDAAASGQARELEAYAATHDKLSAGPPSTVAKIPSGILAGDADLVAAGLDDYLGWHLRSARSRTSDKFNSDRAVICLDAITWLLLAHRRGLEVPVDRKYRRAEVPLRTLYITEWQGQPVDRGTNLSLETDLVAAPWLAAHGLQLPEVDASPGVRGGRRATKAVTQRAGELQPSQVAEFLRRRVDDGRGGVWQLMSWALMIGDVATARRHLYQGLAAARRQWEETRPASGGFLRSLWRSQELPNANFVREHFSLALAAGDEPAIRETAGILRAWMDAVEEDGRRRGIAMAGHPYGHAYGHVDLIADLLAPGGAPRAAVETVFGSFPTARTACTALVSRDGPMLERALNEALGEHVRTLERRTSPPAPLYESAIMFAAAGRRLGLSVETDPRYAAHPVPITIHDPPGSRGVMGRLPCDLMGRQLFA